MIIGPLWGFYNYIKDKCPIPISIDQYFYLFTALHHGDLSKLATKNDLLNFTKIFWLNDPGFNNQYNSYFKAFADWDKFFLTPIQKPLVPDDIATSDTTKLKPVEKSKEDKKTEKSSQASQTNLSKTEDILVDFELVLQDTHQPAIVEEPSTTPWKHDFVLSDQSILPFDVRNFVQRLRRKVETADFVTSDQLNITSMIETFTQKGFIEDIIYEMEDASHSNVVLLSDRFGSMLAYEFLEDHFQAALKQIPYCTFEHYFFYILPTETSDGSHYKLTKADSGNKLLETQNHHWNSNTWFFILSDAGANLGIVDRERMKSSLRFWRYFKNISSHTHWINPVPFIYLNDCTAKRLQITIPMLDPTEKNLYHMING